MVISEYDLVLILWVIGLTLALMGTIYHFVYWRRLGAFLYYLRYGAPPEDAPMGSITAGWLRDAVFALGLRTLLVVLAFERVVLQESIPLEQRGAFAASPLQLGLAVTYLMILIWITRWTAVTRRSRRIRAEQEAVVDEVRPFWVPD